MSNLILQTGKEYSVKDEDILAWQKTYANLDVYHEIDRMSQWLDANPPKRKTSRGIKRFINSWLSRANENKAAGKSTVVRGIKPSGVDSVTDVSWIDDPELKELKMRQYINRHGSYWDGERISV